MLNITRKVRGYDKIIEEIGEQKAEKYALEIQRRDQQKQKLKIFVKKVEEEDIKASKDLWEKMQAYPNQVMKFVDKNIMEYKIFFEKNKQKLQKEDHKNWEKQKKQKYLKALQDLKSAQVTLFKEELISLRKQHISQVESFDSFRNQVFQSNNTEIQILQKHKYKEDLVQVILSKVEQSSQKHQKHLQWSHKNQKSNQSHQKTILQVHRQILKIKIEQSLGKFGEECKKLCKVIDHQIGRQMTHTRHYVKVVTDKIVTTVKLSEGKECGSETEKQQSNVFYLCSIKDCFHKDGEVLHSTVKSKKTVNDNQEQTVDIKTTLVHTILEKEMQDKDQVQKMTDIKDNKLKETFKIMAAGAVFAGVAKDVGKLIKDIVFD